MSLAKQRHSMTLSQQQKLCTLSAKRAEEQKEKWNEESGIWSGFRGRAVFTAQDSGESDSPSDDLDSDSTLTLRFNVEGNDGDPDTGGGIPLMALL